jgi:hypothetical protein
MKATIVSEKAYEGSVAFAHGMSQKVKRLVVEVEGVGNLAITPYGGNVHVSTGFKIEGKENCQVIGYVEVPDELIQKALVFARTKEEIKGFIGAFETLIGKSEE